MTSADGIGQEILADLRNGKKVETTDRYDSIVKAIVENAKERK